MKHLLNLAKRNKSRKPARQSISSGGPAGIAAGSYVESDGIPDGRHSLSRQDLEVDSDLTITLRRGRWDWSADYISE